MNIALIGNPNCGKSTLFNALTGERVKTGNFAGVTVEKSRATLKDDDSVSVTDLPGIYSLSPESSDGKVVTEFLKEGDFDVIVNVIDGGGLEKGLYLTAMLTSVKKPIVIAVNMYDEVKKNGKEINAEKLSALFNAPVVFISALKNYNLNRLVKTAKQVNYPPKNFGTKSIDEINAFLHANVELIETKKKVKRNLTEKIDGVLLNKYLGIPILILIMTAVYFITMKFGGILSQRITEAVKTTSEKVNSALLEKGLATWFCSFLTDGVIRGLGSVLAFFPQVTILFFLMTVIEESGYSARIAFLLDKIFKSIGLGGKSVIPLVLSCGCTVNGVLATRIIENEKERRRTLFLLTFMPCSAKTAVVCWLSSVLFNGNPFVPVLSYFFSFLIVAILGKIMLKRDVGNDSEYPFEVPKYRIPPLKSFFNVLLERTKEFLLKAGSVVFAVSVVLWCLKNFGFSGYGVGIENSFIYILGNAIKYVFYPLGFGSAEASVSVVFGLFARESVAESLLLLCDNVSVVFPTGFSALSFLSFFLLAPPCVSALSALRKESTKKDFVKIIAFGLITAYCVSLLINLSGLLIRSNTLIFCFISGIIILGLAAITVVRTVRRKKWEIKVKHNTIL